jgi:hypothetical protein
VLYFAYPVYVSLMAAALRLIGVSKDEVVTWSLRAAGRRHFIDVISAARSQLPAGAEENSTSTAGSTL